MKKKWVLAAPHPEAAKLASEFKIHPVIASIILRRGLKDSSEVLNFLNPSIEKLEDPFVFSDMRKAVDRIKKAISGKERVLVYGDYDVDGITGSAILYPALKRMGADVEVHIPHRIEEGYGLNEETLKTLLKKKFSLVITVDNGITGVSQIDYLRSRGADTIIVDHHTPKETIPAAYAIVSAAIDGKGDPNLAACGLAFKLAWALLGDFKAVEEYLDLVTVGTVADIAPVLGDNRIILKHGLSALAKTKRVGLRALMQAARMSIKNLSYRDIAFGIGPRINASGRMGSPENAFKLLTTDNELLAQNLAQLLDDGNRDRQRAEAAALEEAVEKVEESYFAATEEVLVLESPDWHEGVLGIVASRLVERYGKPAIVISLKEATGKGSGRSLPNFSLFDCVVKCEDLLMNFGGHAQALGLTIQRDKISHFRNRLNEAVKSHKEISSFEHEVVINAEIALRDLDLRFLKELDSLSPFGPGNPKPLFISRGLKIKGEARKRGQDTLHAWVTDEASRTTCEMIGFRAFGRWVQRGKPERLDLIYQPALKEYNGVTSIELQLEDWK